MGETRKVLGVRIRGRPIKEKSRKNRIAKVGTQITKPGHTKRAKCGGVYIYIYVYSCMYIIRVTAALRLIGSVNT